MQAHIARAHNTEKPFPCEQCPRKYALGVDLRKHIKARHSTIALEIMICPTCDKPCKGYKSLYAHVRTNHKLGGAPRKNLICEFCGKVYSNADAFKEHKAKMHLSTYQPSVCDVCGKKLSDSRSLKKHKLSQHLKTFQYKCSICGSGCLYKSHLEAHMKNSHGGTSLTPERCETSITDNQPPTGIIN